MLIIPPRDIKKKAIVMRWKSTQLYRNYCNEKQQIFLSVLQILLDCMEPNYDNSTCWGKEDNIRSILLLYEGTMNNLSDWSRENFIQVSILPSTLEDIHSTSLSATA